MKLMYSISFVLLLLNNGKGQSILNFQNITKEEGLPHNTIHTICKDNFGFIWIGTNDGLSRYDAEKKFKTYRRGYSSGEGLKSNIISSLFCDENNMLWIGTKQGGLSRLNLETEEWANYIHDPQNEKSISQNEILDIHKDKKGRLWVGTENGLNLYRPETDDFVNFKMVKGDSSTLQANAILSIDEDKDGRIWLGTWAGGLHLLLEDEDSDATEYSFRNFVPNEKVTASKNIWRTFNDSAGRYWIATHEGGLYLMQLPANANSDPQSQDWKATFHSYALDINENKSVISNTIMDIEEAKDGSLWFATVTGISLLQKEILPSEKFLRPTELKPDLSFEQIKKDRNNSQSIVSEVVVDIYIDDQGILWLSTFAGISKFDKLNNQFENLTLIEDVRLPNGHALYVEDSENIFLGTENMGVIVYNSKHDEIKKVYSKESGHLIDNQATALMKRSNDELYVATSRGINILNLKTLTSKFFPIPKRILEKVNRIYITVLFQDSYGRVWIGSELGLFELDLSTGEYKTFSYGKAEEWDLSDMSVTSIVEDNQRNVWISTYNGLNKLVTDVDGEYQITKYHSEGDQMETGLLSNKLKFLAPHGDLLMVGTVNGIFSLNPVNMKCNWLSEKNAPYQIQSLMILEEDQLWASTFESILKLDLGTKQTTSYDKFDGIIDSEFNLGAYDMDEENNLYYTNSTGLVKFKPSEILSNELAPPVYISDAKIIGTKGERSKNLIVSDTIELEHSDYYVSFNFSALNYNLINRNQYAYQLEGFDEDWNYTNNNNPVVYTNLDHGEYTFKVKGSNNDGVWNELGDSIYINKKPAFWETFLFRLLMLFALAFVIFKLVSKAIKEVVVKNELLEDQIDVHVKQLEEKNIRINKLLSKLEHRNSELELLVEKRTKSLQDSNLELKISNKDLEQFAYVASHDLKEPIRMVGNFVGLLSKREKANLDEKSKSYITYVEEGVERMSSLINSLLTYSRVGSSEKEIVRINVNELIDDKLKDLSQVIKDKKVKIFKDDFPEIYGEKQQIGMIFFNLIANGIKFNENPNPEIHILNLTKENEFHFCFAVKDNGIGISKEFQERIFEIFKRLNTRKQYDGTGIGLSICKRIVERHNGRIWIESKKEEGSKFYFTISKSLSLEKKEERLYSLNN